MNNADTEYFKLIDLVLSKGKLKKNRTGIDTIGVFGAQARFDLNEGFPLLTTKKVFFRGIAHELLWFLSGSTNIKYLVDNDVHIWDEWAYKKYTQSFANAVKMNMGITIGNTCYTQAEFIERIKYDAEFAQKWGELGEGTYGGMWRKFPYHKADNIYGVNSGHLESVDQIEKLIYNLKTNPDSRRLIVSAWHPYWYDKCALSPCHCLYQFNTEELTVNERWDLLIKKDNNKSGWWRGMASDENVSKTLDNLNIPKRRLNCQLYQRSCDLALGNPYNIASYALLTHMVAQITNMVVGEFIHSFGDLHIYVPHIENLKIQRTREPYPLPTIQLNPEIKNIFDFKIEDIKLLNYQSHGKLAFEVAV